MTEIKAEFDFVKLANDVACIKQAVMGNGEPGLCQRIDKLEKTEKNLGNLIGFSTGIGALVGSAVTHIVDVLKG